MRSKFPDREKNRVKLLSKRNYIAFFGKKYIELFQKYHGSAMVFYKSLGQAFSKACGVLGQRPKVLDKFIFMMLSVQKVSAVTAFCNGCCA